MSHTVKTANATVPMIKPSELLNLSMKGGFEPCCVNDDSHFGRAIVYGDGWSQADKHLLIQIMMLNPLSQVPSDGKT
jgi:hypothetical protein